MIAVRRHCIPLVALWFAFGSLGLSGCGAAPAKPTSEAQTSTESKASTRPAAETKPATDKPAAEKPVAESKPAADMKEPVKVAMATAAKSEPASKSESAGEADPLDWPMWRGPEQNGISRETGTVDRWEPGSDNVVWAKSELGSRSTPIIMRGKIYYSGP